MSDDVIIRELVGWGLDESSYRPRFLATSPAVLRATAIAGERTGYMQRDPILDAQPVGGFRALSEVLDRADLCLSMHGLRWTVAVVDLRCLVAFQRRLQFDDSLPRPSIPLAGDWAGLTALTFGPPRVPNCELSLASPHRAIVGSSDPNLQIRFSASSPVPALELDAGSPFLEVAEYQNRWFLRDGYHRAYFLLQANITQVPAVVIHARTPAELGNTHPWFFSNDILFGPQPPRVTDFIEPDLVAEYRRPRLYRTFQVTIEESFAPIVPQGRRPQGLQHTRMRSNRLGRPTPLPGSNK